MSNTQLIELLENEPPRSRLRLSASIPKLGRWRFKWLCWSRSLPACLACSIRSG